MQVSNIIASLSERLGFEVRPQKKRIKELITDHLATLEESDDDDEESDEEEDDEEYDVVPVGIPNMSLALLWSGAGRLSLAHDKHLACSMLCAGTAAQAHSKAGRCEETKEARPARSPRHDTPSHGASLRERVKRHIRYGGLFTHDHKPLLP